MSTFVIYALVGILMLAASFGATFLVSFFGGHRDMKSITLASLSLLVLHGALSTLDVGSSMSFGIGAFFSIIIFVKFLDFEPMGALFAGFLFSTLFNVILIVSMTFLSPNEYSSGTMHFPDKEREEHFRKALIEDGVDPDNPKEVMEYIEKMPKFQR